MFHQDNQGPSVARNKGIDQLSDDSVYLTFVDSDDYVHRYYIEEMVKLSVKYDADVVSCKYIAVDELTNHNDECESKEKVLVCEGRARFEGLFNKMKINTVMACCKLFRMNIFQDIRYPIGKLYEDEYVILDILKLANKIVYTNRSYYYYFCRANSIMRSTFNIRKLDIIDILNKRIDFFEAYGDKPYIKAVYSDFFKRLPYFYYETEKIDGNRASEMLIMYRRMLEENRIKISWFARIRYVYFIHNPKAYHLALSMLRRLSK